MNININVFNYITVHLKFITFKVQLKTKLLKNSLIASKKNIKRVTCHSKNGLKNCMPKILKKEMA